MRRISTRFIRVPRRHRSNTSRWHLGTVSCLFVCAGHLVRTHSTHCVLPEGVCYSAELFADLAPPHSCEGFINNWTCSINSRTCSFSARLFLLQCCCRTMFSASSCLMRLVRRSCVILFSRFGSWRTRCIVSHEENLWSFQWDC